MNTYKKEDYMLFVLPCGGYLGVFHRDFVDDHSIRQSKEYVDVMWLVNATQEEKDMWTMLYPSVDITVVEQQIKKWENLRVPTSQRAYWITTELKYTFGAFNEE